MGALFPLCEHIIACRARTLGGFKVQARAASLHFWNTFEDDPDHADALAFVEAACAFAGVVSVRSEEAAIISNTTGAA